ncbi:uncharacterized protein VP01_9609g1 [Puccinia sorghi]|uniref:No apical meristem-associated C-terminal domain-containing protein n=1 Tax=Puccinia sorghi TaxID=27349 RepID=A0A0L6U667_9BASI|nr:uncharacterized protein VP01_9609g1 [Puccinia sorghi]
MANNKGGLSKVNIPKLDDCNFLHWLMCKKAHLRHKGLIKYINKVPVALNGAAADAVNKKHAETVNILMNLMSEMENCTPGRISEKSYHTFRKAIGEIQQRSIRLCCSSDA